MARKDAPSSSIVGSGPPSMSPRLRLPEISKAQYCASLVDAHIAEAGDTTGGLVKHEGRFRGDEVEPIKGACERYCEGAAEVESLCWTV